MSGGDIELAQRIFLIERADVLEVPARAERPALPIEHRDARLTVRIEIQKRLGERVGALRVHGVARLRAVVDHRPHGSVLFDFDGHDGFPLSRSGWCGSKAIIVIPDCPWVQAWYSGDTMRSVI